MTQAELEVDLLVMGAGSGGVRAARVAAGLGARVAICEERFLGGTCVNVGCVPKKLMVYGAHYADERHEAEGYGWSTPAPTHDWSRLMANKDAEIQRLHGVYQRLLESKGVTILRGRGALCGPTEARVTGPEGATHLVRAKHILIATGGRATRLSIPGAEHAMISDDVFTLAKRPERLVIVGGGYIAVEFAGVFNGYGSRVTQLYRGALFLRGFDHDVRAHLDTEMRRRGIDLRFRRDIAAIERVGDTLRVTLDDGAELETDAVLAAIGRAPNSDHLGLEGTGVETNPRGAILVDERFRTSVSSVYAIGDVIDRIQLTPVALAEGMIVAQNLFGNADRRAEYDVVPSAVFSTPPIGSVGMTEEEARAEVGAIDIYTSRFTPMKNTMTGSGPKTLMKLIVCRETDRVLGLHMVGPQAGEIVQGFAVALKCGATKAQFDRTIGIHPTAAEEFVTMREKCPEPDHDAQFVAKERPTSPRIVHHRWEHD